MPGYSLSGMSEIVNTIPEPLSMQQLGAANVRPPLIQQGNRS